MNRWAVRATTREGVEKYWRAGASWVPDPNDASTWRKKEVADRMARRARFQDAEITVVEVDVGPRCDELARVAS